jgi:hypothetical protein
MARKSPARPSSTRELLFGGFWKFHPVPESAPNHIEANYGLFIGGRFVAANTAT